jgi:hypothetical protein
MTRKPPSIPKLVPPDNPRRERPAHEERPSERQVPANRPAAPPKR